MQTFKQHLTEKQASAASRKAAAEINRVAKKEFKSQDKDDLEIIADDLLNGDIEGAGRSTKSLDTAVRDVVTAAVDKHFDARTADTFYKAAKLVRLK